MSAGANDTLHQDLLQEMCKFQLVELPLHFHKEVTDISRPGLSALPTLSSA